MNIVHLNELDNLDLAGDVQIDGLWLPAEQLMSCEIPLPAAPRRKWQQVVPWMMEDQLLESPETMHFVYLQGSNTDTLEVLAVSKQQMTDWIEQATRQGINPVVMLPDYLALPWQEGQVSIAESDGKLLVRYGRALGFAASPELAFTMIHALMPAAEDASVNFSLELYGNIELPESLQQYARQQDTKNWKGPVDLAANMRTGSFAPSDHSFRDYIKQWGLSAALLASLLALLVLNIHVSNRSLFEQVSFQAQSNLQQARALYPGLAISSQDVRGSVEAYMDDGFIQQLGLDSTLIKAIELLDPYLSSCDCKVTSMEFSAGRLQLEIDSGMPAGLQSLSPQDLALSVAGLEDGKTLLTVSDRGGR